MFKLGEVIDRSFVFYHGSQDVYPFVHQAKERVVSNMYNRPFSGEKAIWIVICFAPG